MPDLHAGQLFEPESAVVAEGLRGGRPACCCDSKRGRRCFLSIFLSLFCCCFVVVTIIAVVVVVVVAVVAVVAVAHALAVLVTCPLLLRHLWVQQPE